MLIINTSNKTTLQDTVSAGTQVKGLLDIKGKLTADFPRIKLGDLGDLDMIFSAADTNYINFIEKLVQVKVNNEPITDQVIHGLPVFWITPAAIKNPITHWGRDFFVLSAILEFGSKTINERFTKLMLVVPNEIIQFQPDFEQYVRQLGIDIELEIVPDVLSQKPFSLFHLIKASAVNAFQMLSFPVKKYPSLKHTNVLYILDILRNQATLKTQFDPLKSLMEKQGRNIQYFPYLEWKLKAEEKAAFPVVYKKAKPSFWQLIHFNIQLIQLFLKLKKASISNFQLFNQRFDASFIRRELTDTLVVYSSIIYGHIWLKNYFDRIDTPTHVFFEDEFYETGKVIAASAMENKQINSYGLQHGHFNEAHTVYTLGEAECQKQKRNPLPDSFIVWGKYYGDLFRSKHKTNYPKVEELGSLKLIHNRENAKAKVEKSLLWCLTSKECFGYEWEILKSSTLLADFDLKIRLHPRAHVKKEDVQNALGDTSYSYSEEPQITAAMEAAFFVLTSAHSTVFLDAMVRSKPTIRLITNRWIGSAKFRNAHLFDVSSSVELDDALQLFSTQDKTESGETDVSFLELSEEKWKDFITQNIAP